MRKWTKTAGLLFLAAASVYTDRATLAGSAKSASSSAGHGPATDVKLLEDVADPFAAESSVSTGAGATVSSANPSTAPASSQPLNGGTSVNSTDVSVSDAGTVEIHVNDANLVEVLRMLSLQSQKNIIASKDVRGTVTANLYDVTVREALDAILHANGYAYREQGNFIYVYTAKELAEIEKAERRPATEVFRLFYTPAANAVNMIKPVLSGDAQVSYTTPAASGIASGGGDAGGNSHAAEDILVITDYTENLERVANILKEVDRRPQQILIEATILRAALSEDNSLGVDFTILGGVDFSTLTGAGSSSGQALSGAILNNSGASNIVQQGYGAAGTGFTGNLPQGGLRLGIVQNNIAVFLQALESITDTVVLANPKVLALNKQKGEVLVGREDGYLTTTVTESSTVQTVEFLETGTRLVFRPYIGDDGFIRMEIHPEDSSGGLTGANLPFKITTEVTSNVMVKDGHTIVIGGLFRESSETARGQVPFLGNIPLAGALFRNQRDRTLREEIIILLTPHIVKDEVAYSKESEAMLKDAERMRVGVRKGMMFFGRERLAESCYDEAVKEMNKPSPDRQKALWHLNCATNLNPKFMEAIELKEQLTGREVTSVDSSSIRGFVRRSILSDVARPAEPEPTTVPVGDALTALAPAPTSQPASTQPMTADSATTQPTDALTGGATTQPGEELADAATTQPVAEEVADETTEVVAEQVVEMPAEPTIGEMIWDTVATKVNEIAPTPAPVVTSQPSATTVTELPMDDAAGEAPVTGDDNK